jgi:hypothetical protein
MANLRTVAVAAGVHVATASAVLNPAGGNMAGPGICDPKRSAASFSSQEGESPNTRSACFAGRPRSNVLIHEIKVSGEWR